MSDFLNYIKEQRLVSESPVDHKELIKKYEDGKMSIQSLKKELEKTMSKDAVKDILKKLVESSCNSSKKKTEEYSSDDEEMEEGMDMKLVNQVKSKFAQLAKKEDALEKKIKKIPLMDRPKSKEWTELGKIKAEINRMKMVLGLEHEEFEDNMISEEVSASKVIKDLGDTDWGKDNDAQMKAVQLLKGLALSEDPMSNEFMKALSDASTTIAKKILNTSETKVEKKQVSEGSVNHASSILDGVQEASLTQINDDGRVIRPRESMSSIANKACDILG
jgi:hypothetical protein